MRISEGLQTAINMGLNQIGQSVLTPGNARDVVAGLKEVNPLWADILGDKIVAAAGPLLAPSDSNPVLGYMRDLTYQIMREQGCEVDYVGFDRYTRAHFWDRETTKGYKEIRYGVASLDYWTKVGYWEYTTVATRLGVPRLFKANVDQEGPGMYAVHHIVLHEVAHALTNATGGAGYTNGKRATHGDKFVYMLYTLMTKYPFYKATSKEYLA